MLPIYDKDFVRLNDYDASMGRLEKKSRVIHTDAVEAIAEQWHYETVREYPETGGRDVERVIDTAGVPGREAEDVVEDYYLFVPYTAEEREEQREPMLRERAAALEKENVRLKAQVQALTDRGEFVEDCLAEMAAVVYG